MWQSTVSPQSTWSAKANGLENWEVKPMPIVTVQGYSSGNHLEVTAEGKLPVEMTANVEVGAVTATDVTIHDAVTTDNKLKINADGSIPAQLAATYALVTTHHNGAGANANGNAADVEGYGSASIQISGTFEGTISFEGSVDGVNYVPIRALDGAGTPVTSATAAGIFKADCAGLKYLRCPLSGYASGSVTVKSRAVLMARPTAQTVQLSGSLLERYGATEAQRPAANSVPIGTVYMAVQTQQMWQSDGSQWVVM